MLLDFRATCVILSYQNKHQTEAKPMLRAGLWPYIDLFTPMESMVCRFVVTKVTFKTEEGLDEDFCSHSPQVVFLCRTGIALVY